MKKVRHTTTKAGFASETASITSSESSLAPGKRRESEDLTFGPTNQQKQMHEKLLYGESSLKDGPVRPKVTPSNPFLKAKAFDIRKTRMFDERRKQKMKIFRQIVKFLKLKRRASSLDRMMEEQGLRKIVRKELTRPGPRYKRPIDKLLKKAKQEMIEDLHPSVNVHKHRDHQASFIGSRGVRKQVELIHSVLQKHHKKVQPKWGWDYNKRQKRLLLGYRHRKLNSGWKYFEPIKDLFPRRIKPNNHWPDAVFFFCNAMIFITSGYHFGLAFAMQTLNHPLEDLWEYEHFVRNEVELSGVSGEFWHKVAPLESVSNYLAIVFSLIIFIIILGFVGVYLADQTLHFVYFMGMLIGLISECVLTVRFQAREYCTEFMDTVTPLLYFVLERYYEMIVAKTLTNETVNWTPDRSVLKDEPAKIRTYKAANIMDRIQRNLLCCGVEGPEDYTSRNMRLPTSCCSPLWNLNMYCSRQLPFDLIEYKAKLLTDDERGIGCNDVFVTICKNSERLLGPTAQLLNEFHLTLFIISCIALIIQNRQIRQLKRVPHLRISAGSISQSLQASAADAGVKGGGIQAVVEATKMTDKQAEQLQKMRTEAGLQNQDSDEESSSSSESSEEIPVHTINLNEMKNLQSFVDKEDKGQAEKQDLEKTVEGFAGRFNIVANKNLQSYVTGIFSSTYQNETNAGLEAINQTLEQQFAQHTTDYNWRKLLHKTKRDPRQFMTKRIAPKFTASKIPKRKE